MNRAVRSRHQRLARGLRPTVPRALSVPSAEFDAMAFSACVLSLVSPLPRPSLGATPNASTNVAAVAAKLLGLAICRKIVVFPYKTPPGQRCTEDEGVQLGNTAITVGAQLLLAI